MEPVAEPDDFIEIETMTIDQFAGATALIISSIGALLTIIWQSRCLCRCRVGLSDKCYLFDCERRPPPVDEESGESKNKKKENKKEDKKNNKKPTDPIKPTQSSETLVPPQSPVGAKEPEPEPEIEPPSAEELRSLT